MRTNFLLLIACVLFIASCGNESKENANVPAGMTQVDLTKYGLDATINIPDSTNGTAEIVQQSWGATEIKIGQGFQLSIIEDAGDISLAKSDVAGNDVNKLKKYLIDEPTTILYESSIIENQSEYHLYAIIKTGEKSFVVEDIKGDAFSEKEIRTMLESAKSITAKTKSASGKAS
ncbi:MAG: hypothetical protein J0M08_08100 [Bacteroidetes bacterium]|nr:hypothetical protein [Bacteroidota bacterium]